MGYESPAENFRRFNPLPGQLEKGDVLRDHGVLRRVARTEPDNTAGGDLITVYFTEDQENPELPETLAIQAGVRITAWRTDD